MVNSKVSNLSAASALDGTEEIHVIQSGSSLKATVNELRSEPDTALAGSTGTFSGVVSVDDTTQSTSGITGSVHTDGGIGAAKDIFGSTINATGDTTSGDLAAFGYDSTNGARITGQGSTNDVVIVNDADVIVIAVPTGTTNTKLTGPNLTIGGNELGAERLTIADDAVGSVTPPKTGGWATITTRTDGDFPDAQRSATFYYDTGSSLAIAAVFENASSLMDFVTTDVTGTTGIDGEITVAAQSGVIKIENRMGSSDSFTISFYG